MITLSVFGDLMHGFGTVLDPMNLLWAVLGVTLGMLVGILPGIGPAPALALLLPITFNFSPPIGAFSGTSRRSCSVVLSLVETIAAAAGWPPPSSVTVQPCGAPLTEKAKRSGGSA